MTLVRYVQQWDIPRFQAEGWILGAFYAHRGPCAVFLMAKPETAPAGRRQQRRCFGEATKQKIIAEYRRPYGSATPQ